MPPVNTHLVSPKALPKIERLARQINALLVESDLQSMSVGVGPCVVSWQRLEGVRLKHPRVHAESPA